MAQTYQDDQLQSTSASNPADTEPESSIAAWLRYLTAAILGWVDIEHYRTGKHKRFYALATNSGNAYSVSIPHYLTALDTGLSIWVTFPANNTAASTLEVIADDVSLGTIDIKKGTTDVEADDLVANLTYLLLYDGTDFQLVFSPSLAGTVRDIHIISPATGYTGGSGPIWWLSINAVTASGGAIPLGASAVLLQIHGYDEVENTPAPTKSILLKEGDNLPEIVGLQLQCNEIHTKLGITVQAWCRLASDGTFQFSASASNGSSNVFFGGFVIQIIGYYG